MTMAEPDADVWASAASFFAQVSPACVENCRFSYTRGPPDFGKAARKN